MNICFYITNSKREKNICVFLRCLMRTKDTDVCIQPYLLELPVVECIDFCAQA